MTTIDEIRARVERWKGISNLSADAADQVLLVAEIDRLTAERNLQDALVSQEQMQSWLRGLMRADWDRIEVNVMERQFNNKETP